MVALALNKMKYNNKDSWNMVNLAILSLVYSKYIRWVCTFTIAAADWRQAKLQQSPGSSSSRHLLVVVHYKLEYKARQETVISMDNSQVNGTIIWKWRKENKEKYILQSMNSLQRNG